MKRIFILAGIACAAFASCQKTESVAVNNDKVEIAVSALNKGMTKGYVTGTTFEDVAKANLLAGTPAVDRAFILSAYDKNLSEDYVIAKEFTKKADKQWTCATPIYYPLGGHILQFLAYSVKDSAPVANWENSQKVTLQVTEESSDDDILYAAAEASAATQDATTEDAVAMVFDHAQAWLTVKLTSNIADDAATKPFAVDEIVWKNIYNSGELTLEYGATATAKWNFFTQVAKDVTMNDDLRTSNDVTATATQLDMLIPAQSAAPFVINYTLGGNKFEYVIPTSEYASITEFEMGKHYTFNLNFTITEVTVNPTVTAWVDVVGFGTDPLEL